MATVTSPGPVAEGDSAAILAAVRAASMDAAAFFCAALLLSFCTQHKSCVKRLL